jgi:hypothetical protein
MTVLMTWKKANHRCPQRRGLQGESRRFWTTQMTTSTLDRVLMATQVKQQTEAMWSRWMLRTLRLVVLHIQ